MHRPRPRSSTRSSNGVRRCALRWRLSSSSWPQRRRRDEELRATARNRGGKGRETDGALAHTAPRSSGGGGGQRRSGGPSPTSASRLSAAAAPRDRPERRRRGVAARCHATWPVRLLAEAAAGRGLAAELRDGAARERRHRLGHRSSRRCCGHSDRRWGRDGRRHHWERLCGQPPPSQRCCWRRRCGRGHPRWYDGIEVMSGFTKHLYSYSDRLFLFL
jgi:hypothetical protein